MSQGLTKISFSGAKFIGELDPTRNNKICMIILQEMGVAYMQSVKGVALGSLDNMGNWLSELNRLYTLGQDSNTCSTYSVG